jgi:multidrug resistance efflux pump
MSPTVTKIVLGLVGLGFAYGGYRFWQSRQPYEWSGTVEARTINVGSRVGGRVKELAAHEGDRINAGQPLLVFEPGDLEAQRLMAKGQLDQAAAALEKSQRGARPEEIAEANARAVQAAAQFEQTRTGARREQISAAEARLQASGASLEKARLDRERIGILFAKQAATRADRDNAETAYQTALANRDAAKQQRDELVNGSRREEVTQAAARAAEARAGAKLVQAGSRVEDIKAAQAAVDAAKGRLDQIDVSIAELVVRSPRPARVEALDLRPGDIVAPSATVATLLEEDQLYVRIYVPETQLGRIHLGQQVQVSVDSFPDKRFAGVVEHINTVGEYSPRNLQTADERADQVFQTRVGLQPDARAQLRAGMAAFLRVPK